MPEIIDLPEPFVNAPGVQMTPPPQELIPSIMGAISKATSNLNEDEKAKLVWIAQTHNGKQSVNAALVVKAPAGIEVIGWFGKTWGEPIDAGIAGQKTWRF